MKGYEKNAYHMNTMYKNLTKRLQYMHNRKEENLKFEVSTQGQGCKKTFFWCKIWHPKLFFGKMQQLNDFLGF